MLTVLIAATLLNATYVSERCGFAFEYPDGWIAIENPKAKIDDGESYPPKLARCAVGLKPRGWERENRGTPFDGIRYAMEIVKWNRGFVESAQASYFARVADVSEYGVPTLLSGMKPWDWSIMARGGQLPAYTYTTHCCQVVRGESWSRVWGSDNSVGTLTWEGAVVNDRRGHSLVIYSTYYPETLTRIIESVRFGSFARRRSLPADYTCNTAHRLPFSSHSSRRIP